MELEDSRKGVSLRMTQTKQSFTPGLLNSTRSSEKTAQTNNRWEANMPCFLSYKKGENLRMN